MLSSLAVRFRPFIWFLIICFTVTSTPHIELLFPFAVRLMVPEVYAAEGEAPESEIASPDGAASDGVSTGSGPASAQAMAASSSPSGADSQTTTGSGGGGPSGVSASASLFSGAATVSIPIEVPPGRRGMAPKLAITYNSQLPNGWLGVGFTLDLGSIQRSTKRGVDYAGTDFVAVLNGASAELVPRSTDWGTGYYSAKIEGAYMKYRYNSSTKGWEVTAKDGTVYKYGSTAASRQDFASGTKIFKWCLDTVTDTNGNYMNIYYSKNQGEIYLDHIDYAGNNSTSLDPKNTVQFYLESRTDTPPMYTANYLVVTAYRLSYIEVRNNNSRVRKYTLTYETSYSTDRSLLASVQQFGTDGTSALPATTFTWDNPSTRWRYDAVSNPGNPINDFNTQLSPGLGVGWVNGDYNGDGKTDFMGFAQSGASAALYYNYSRNDDGTYAYEYSPQTGGLPRFGFLGDHNGDGRSDHMGVSGGVGAGVTWVFYTATSNGNGSYAYNVQTTTLATPRTDTYLDQTDFGKWFHWFSGDANGDGKTDLMGVQLVALYDIYGSPAGYGVAFVTGMSNGNRTYTTYYQSTDLPWSDDAVWFTGDVNGDGKTDFMAVRHEPYLDSGLETVVFTTATSNGDGTYAVQSWQSNGLLFFNRNGVPDAWFPGDANGDGKTDFMAMQGQNYYTFVSALTKGDGTYDVRTQLTTSLGNLWSGSSVWTNTFYSADVNGDGKADVVGSYWMLTGGSVLLYLFVATGRGDGTYEAPVPPSSSQDYPLQLQRSNFYMAPGGDLNGDGKPDFTSVLCKKNGQWYAGQEMCYYHFYDAITTAPFDLVTRVDNGLGGYSEIEYLSSALNKYEGPVPSSDCNLPYAVQTVASITTYDGSGIAGQRTKKKHEYSGGCYSIPDRDFRGFAGVMTYQVNAQDQWVSRTETWFSQNSILKGLTISETATAAEGSKTVTYDWDAPCVSSSSVCTNRANPKGQPLTFDIHQKTLRGKT